MSWKIVSKAKNKKELAREWRNQKLHNTDWIVPITDHPQHASYMTYRQALRDWTDTADFPNTKPVLGE